MPSAILGGGSQSSRNMIPFFYRVPVIAIAASGTSTAILQTDGDSIFTLAYFQGSTDLDLASDISPNNFSVRIQLLSGGRLLSNDFIPQRILCPTQQFYVPEPYQIQIPGNSQLQFDFRNLNTGSTVNIDLVLRGTKLYGAGLS